jgi:hypothetical protein
MGGYYRTWADRGKPNMHYGTCPTCDKVTKHTRYYYEHRFYCEECGHAIPRWDDTTTPTRPLYPPPLRTRHW